MKGLVRFTLAQTVLFNLVFVLAMVVGVFAVLDMPVERYPNVQMGKVLITTFYPGAAPQEVETLVTKKIEDALDDLKNVEFIQSTSFRQRSSIMVKFVDDTNYQELADELRFKVLSRVGELPAEADPPEFTVIQVNEWLPVVSVNLIGQRSNQALTLMAKELKISLRQISGVRKVDLQGERTREFHVLLDPAKLSRYGVTFDQAANAIADSGLTIPAGDFTSTGGELVIKADERYKSRHQVLSVIVRSDADGSFVRISDLASDALLDYRDPVVLSSVNGQDCVSLRVIKTDQGNALDILERVREVVAGFEPRLAAEGVGVAYTEDSTIEVKDAMRTLGSNLILGICLVVAVITYFMGWQNALITTVGIPFSFLFTMVIMWITGNSLNEITLFSFVLVSGLVVDDAIVVVENIYRHYQEGMPMGEAVVNGTAEVFWPVVAATATTVAAFLPMLIMTGMVGEFFALIPKAVTFALAASLFECLFILPLHYLDWGPRRLKATIDAESLDFSGEGRAMAGLRWLLKKSLALCLRFRWATLAAVFCLLLAAILVVGVSASGTLPLLKVKFFPDEYTLYYVVAELPADTPLETTHAYIRDLGAKIAQQGPGMTRSAAATAGMFLNEDYEPVFASNLGQVVVSLPKNEDRHFADHPRNDPVAHMEWLRRQLLPLAPEGGTLRVRPEKGGPPAGKDVNVRVVGNNPESVAGLAARMKDFLRSDSDLGPDLVDLVDNQGIKARVWQFSVEKERTAEFGLNPATVLKLAAALLKGRYVSQYRLADEDVDLKVKLDPASVPTPEDALGVPLVEHPSGPVRLGEVVVPKVYQGTGYLNRYQGERAITLTANLRPGAQLSTPVVVARCQDFYRSVADQYPGATLNFAGEFESTRKSYMSLSYAFLVALLLIYMILATQFKSYLQPMIILSAIAFALIGVVFGKLVTQSLFTINSFIATVGVAGVAVNDSLVLIDFLNSRRRQGLDRREAVWQAVMLRLRPILLTTVTTTLGLLPMAVGWPQYSLVWGAMASTFVTGLCTATVLTLLVVPVQWDLLEGWQDRRRARRQARKGAVDSPAPEVS